MRSRHIPTRDVRESLETSENSCRRQARYVTNRRRTTLSRVPIHRVYLDTDAFVQDRADDDEPQNVEPEELRLCGLPFPATSPMPGQQGLRAGSASHSQLEDLAGPALAKLQGKAIHIDEVPPVPHPGVHRHPRDLEQTHLCLGIPCVSVHDPEWYAAYLLHTALGGGMSSRLFQEIRERRGLVYDVTSFLSSYRDSGYLGVYAATSAESVAEVVELSCAIIRDIVREGISAEELRRAKGHAKGGLLLGLETSESRMDRLARCEIYFRRDIPIAEVAADVEHVTVEAVHAFAVQYLGSAPRTLTLLGEIPKKTDYQALIEG